MEPLLRQEVNHEGAEQCAEGCVTPDKTCSNSGDGSGGGWTLLCCSAICCTFSPSHPSPQTNNCPTNTGMWTDRCSYRAEQQNGKTQQFCWNLKRGLFPSLLFFQTRKRCPAVIRVTAASTTTSPQASSSFFWSPRQNMRGKIPINTLW